MMEPRVLVFGTESALATPRAQELLRLLNANKDLEVEVSADPAHLSQSNRERGEEKVFQWAVFVSLGNLPLPLGAWQKYFQSLHHRPRFAAVAERALPPPLLSAFQPQMLLLPLDHLEPLVGRITSGTATMQLADRTVTVQLAKPPTPPQVPTRVAVAPGATLPTVQSSEPSLPPPVTHLRASVEKSQSGINPEAFLEQNDDSSLKLLPADPMDASTPQLAEAELPPVEEAKSLSLAQARGFSNAESQAAPHHEDSFLLALESNELVSPPPPPSATEESVVAEEVLGPKDLDPSFSEEVFEAVEELTRANAEGGVKLPPLPTLASQKAPEAPVEELPLDADAETHIGPAVTSEPADDRPLAMIESFEDGPAGLDEATRHGEPGLEPEAAWGGALPSLQASSEDSSEVETLKRYAALKEREAREREGGLEILQKQMRQLQEKLSRSELERRKLLLELDEAKALCRTLQESKEQNEHHQARAESAHQEELKALQLRLDNAQFQASRAEKKLDEFRERVRSDVLKIRMRERELANKLELQKRDAEALLVAKDERLLQQKRDIDRLEYEMSSLKERLLEETSRAEERAGKLTRALKSLKMAQGMLSGIQEEVVPGAAVTDPDDRGEGEAA